MIVTRRSTKARRRASERRQWLALATVMAVGLGALAWLGREVMTRTPRPSPVQSTADARKLPQDAETYTGSILFMPQSGSACRQFLFDNVSGSVSDNGVVDCERGAYHPLGDTSDKSSGTRVHIISSAFRDR
jgi:hypothetical protein